MYKTKPAHLIYISVQAVFMVSLLIPSYQSDKVKQ